MSLQNEYRKKNEKGHPVRMPPLFVEMNYFKSVIFFNSTAFPACRRQK